LSKFDIKTDTVQ